MTFFSCLVRHQTPALREATLPHRCKAAGKPCTGTAPRRWSGGADGRHTGRERKEKEEQESQEGEERRGERERDVEEG